ncbi:MAG: hypothetical protein MUC87_04930 [Bacteroidia bacterium]|jgi:hypothetical protein|nr:hypothetical protein [Bacteroidia bacterium]
MDKKDKLWRLENLLNNLKEIDLVIAEHRRLDSDNFMINQYEVHKVKLLGQFFEEVKISRSKNGVTDLYFLGLLAQKYFQNTPDQPSAELITDPEYKKLLSAI